MPARAAASYSSKRSDSYSGLSETYRMAASTPAAYRAW